MLTALICASAVRAQTIYTVTNLADSGTGTLREALEQAERDGGDSTVRFAVAGTIQLAAPLIPLQESRTRIEGASSPAPGITLAPAPGSPPFVPFYLRGNELQIAGITLRDLDDRCMICEHNASNITLEDLHIIDCSQAIGLNAVSHITVRRCTIERTGGFALSMLNAADCTFGPGNTIRAAGDTAIVINTGCTSARVTANRIQASAQAGIAVFSPDTQIDGNEISDAATDGIQIQGTSGCTISNNSIENSGRDGLSVIRSPASSTPHRIGPANTIERNHWQGIRISSSSGAIISANTSISRNALSGILVLGSPDIVVTDNLSIAANHRQGIQVANSSDRAQIGPGNVFQGNGNAGIWLDSLDHVVEGNAVLGNFSAGIDLRLADRAIIRGNQIEGNCADGILVNYLTSQVRILGNYIVRNCTGIFEAGTSGDEIAYNWISENDGRGVAIDLSDTWIHDNVILANGLSGVESRWTNTSARVINNTFAANDLGAFGGGEYWNNILWGNAVFDLFVPSTATVRSCIIQTANLSFPPSSGNLAVDPEFVDLASGDVHILATSPARDAGDGSAPGIGSQDIDGGSRLAGVGIDIGADEFAPLLYFQGDMIPGASGHIRLLGEPLSGPAVLLLSSFLFDPPLSTPWGQLHLRPPMSSLLLGVFPPSGLLELPATLPPGAAFFLGLQAFDGQSLSNLTTIEWD